MFEQIRKSVLRKSRPLKYPNYKKAEGGEQELTCHRDLTSNKTVLASTLNPRHLSPPAPAYAIGGFPESLTFCLARGTKFVLS